MATFSKYLASDILQIISDLRGESSVNSDAVRLRAIDRAVSDFSTRRFWNTYRRINQTFVSTGAGDYEIGSSSYPYRIKGLTELFSSTTGLTGETDRHLIVSENDFKKQYNEANSTKLVYEWYDPANDKWMIHINPDTSGDTITYSYYWQSPAVTATTSAIYAPDPDLIARRALAYLYEGEDEDKYTEMYQLSEQIADSWDKIEDTPNVNQTYSITAQSDFGIGSY